MKRKWWKVVRVVALSVGIVFVPYAPVAIADEEVVVSPSPSPSAEPAAVINTGEAGAVAAAESIVNTVLVGESEIETSTVVVGEDTGDLAPFATIIPSSSPTPAPTAAATASAELMVNSQAEVITEASASATTGDNVQESVGGGGNVSITTGNATAIATAVTVANSTLVNSSLEVGTVSVTAPWSGNLILDPPMLNTASEAATIFPQIPLTLMIDNEGNVVTEANAVATTGGNTQVASGSAQMTTGVASALSSSGAIVNTTLMGVDILALLPENIWLWEGKIRNWEYPGSVSDARELMSMVSQESSECGAGCTSAIGVNNEATVVTSASAVANTGENVQTTEGDATVQTGNAVAGATATAVVNTTLVDSRVRILHLLLFAPWTGDLIFAYPDLVTSVTAPATVNEGEDILYTITVTNRGYATARGILVSHTIVNDEHTVAEGSNTVGELLPGESSVRTISFNTAGRANHQVKLTATAEGSNTEESMGNNSALATTLVVGKAEEVKTAQTSDSSSNELPKLELSGSNNINEFVYPGDGVTYDLNVMNTGGSVRETVLVQRFFDPTEQEISVMNGTIGEIGMNKKRSIHFVLKTNAGLEEGVYYTESYAVGKSEGGSEVKSNTLRHEVRLKSKNWGQTMGVSVEAKEPPQENLVGETGEVLGVTSQAQSKCEDCVSWPWYLALAGGTLAYYWISLKRRDFVQVLKWGLVLPLSAYTGLLMRNPDCRAGIMFLSTAESWCRYFLPYSYGIYGSLMIGLKRGLSRNN